MLKVGNNLTLCGSERVFAGGGGVKRDRLKQAGERPQLTRPKAGPQEKGAEGTGQGLNCWGRCSMDQILCTTILRSFMCPAPHTG